MNTQYDNTIDLNSFADFIYKCSDHISPLYERGARIIVDKNKIELYRPTTDSFYNLFKKNEEGLWVPFHDDDIINIEFSDHHAILLTVTNSEFTIYEDFKFPLTFVPEKVDIVYNWIQNGVFENAMLNNESDYGIIIKNKYYKEIIVDDRNVYPDDPGEITLSICDIIDVDVDSNDFTLITYRISKEEVATLTLNYKGE